MKLKINLSKVILLMLISLFTVILGNAQPKDNKITLGYQFKNQPVKILNHTEGQGNNWIEDFSVEVENISGKPIYFLELHLQFEKITDTDEPVAIQLSYGTSPKDNNISGLIPIPPNGTTRLKIPRETSNAFTQYIQHFTPVEKIQKAEINIFSANFGDGSAWQQGIVYFPKQKKNTSLMPNLQNNSASTYQSEETTNDLIQKCSIVTTNGHILQAYSVNTNDNKTISALTPFLIQCFDYDIDPSVDYNCCEPGDAPGYTNLNTCGPLRVQTLHLFCGDRFCNKPSLYSPNNCIPCS